ncbi:MAG: hypothetical protein GF308_08980 [Candidatus Heimdallarchaeota archaeon]|nr:hypothetical protein [Candidatus Heimdallarchaeota archaeon]
MLTSGKIEEIMLKLKEQDGLGCFYDFKEQFGISLKVFETLSLVKRIQRYVPDCEDHCIKYCDCPWIDHFYKRKSKTKYKWTKQGAQLAEELSQKSLTAEKKKQLIRNMIQDAELSDTIFSMLLAQKKQGISLPNFINYLLSESDLGLKTIRIALRDILDLYCSLHLITIDSGIILMNNVVFKQ